MKATVDISLPIQASERGPYPIGSLRFAASYVVTMRPYLLFVSGITAIVGVAFVPTIAPTAGLLIAAAGFLAYGFGQALTDCTQTDTDAISSPYRPLVRGDIAKRDVAMISIVGLLAISAIFIAYNSATFVLLLASVGGLASYTWFKRRWWGGPMWNSWIVVTLAMASYMAARGAQQVDYPIADASRGALLCALGLVFFGYANFVLTGYYKDIAADAATGYDTMLVHFGRRVSAIVSDLLAVAAVGLTIVTWYILGGLRAVPVPALLFLLAGIHQTVTAQWNLHHVHSDKAAYHAIAPVVHAYILLLSSIVLVLHPAWNVEMLAYFAAYLIALKYRPLASQI